MKGASWYLWVTENPLTACVRHGVPHGSILGPLLFIAFINDLPLHVSLAQIDLYADDTTLTSAANFDSVGVLQSSPTTAISEVDQWATANKLPLNEGKTKRAYHYWHATFYQN